MIVTTFGGLRGPDVKVVTKHGRSRRAWMTEMVKAASGAHVAVLSGGVALGHLYDELVVARALLSIRPHIKVLLAECWWEPGSRRLNRLYGVHSPPGVDDPPRYVLTHAIRRLLRSVESPRTHYAVLSGAERRMFAENWDVPVERVHFTPYHFNDAGDATVVRRPRSVFAGGDALRDYRPLIEAAAGLDAEVTIATRLPAPADLPQNVHYGALPPDVYRARAREAATVVVCLRPGTSRSAGQQNYLNAMVSGTPLVVTDALGVRDYVENGVTGFVAANQASDLRRATTLALSGNREVKAMTTTAREYARREFSVASYFTRLERIARQITGAL